MKIEMHEFGIKTFSTYIWKIDTAGGFDNLATQIHYLSEMGVKLKSKVELDRTEL